MRIEHSNKKRRIIIIILLAIVLIAGGIAVFVLTRANTNDPSKIIQGVNYNPPTDEQKSSGTDTKKDFVDKAYPSENPSLGSQSSQAVKNVDIAVTNHGPSGSVYQFRTLISTTAPGGTCTLTMTADGRQIITKTIDVQNVGTYSVCAGYFDIPLSQLTGATWKTSIEYKSNQASGSVGLSVKVD